MSKIIWIDEDYGQFTAECDYFKAAGYEVLQILNATDALNEIQTLNINEISFLIIDVMLNPGDNEEIFSSRRTNGFKTTGLTLMEEIGGINDLYLKKSVFYSCAGDSIVAKVHNFNKKNKTKYLRKDNRENIGLKFVSQIIEWSK